MASVDVTLFIIIVVVICTDLSGKGTWGMGRVVTSRILADVMVSTLTKNAKDVCSISSRGVIFAIFITTYDAG